MTEPEDTISNNLRSEIDTEKFIGKRVGPFQIQQKLASDYWGVLYEALQVAVHRTVAVKVLYPSFYENSEIVQQFTAFASAMAQAQNPYITTVYEAGTGNGLIFYAREHVDGVNLQEYFKQDRLLSEELILQIIMSIGEALNYEKKNEIQHTCLLPEQILIPNVGVPKLLNNVTLGGEEASPGEFNEIRCLSTIIKQGVKEASLLSPALNTLLEKMEQAGTEEGCNDWNMVLHEANQLDLNLRAMRAVRPILATSVEEPEPKSTDWIKWLAIGLSVFCLGGILLWYFVVRLSAPKLVDVETAVEVPANDFIYQDGKKLFLPTFYIDKYEVTIGQYRKFLEAWNRNKMAIREHPKQGSSKDHTPEKWGLLLEAIEKKTALNGQRIYEQTPVFNIDYFDAWAYAQWAGKRLPTEQEWEKAARGLDGNLFPWGNTFDANKANTGADRGDSTSDSNFGKIDGFGLWAPVGAVRKDLSPYGVNDMAGNVQEWTDSWDTHPDFPTEQVPVIRGGSWASLDVRLTIRERSQSKLKRSQQIGFRCVSDKPPLKK